jgi:cytochrome c-type biogenesis protein
MVTSFGFAFLAGVLSTLSPCVLPLLPVVLGAAASQHRLGPLALAAGLASSFVLVGLFVATAGFSIGLDAGVFRMFAAGAMLLVGLALLMPALQAPLARAFGPAVTWGSDALDTISDDGWTGQFLVGLLLGAVWSPCVGPTLGAASVLAAQGKDLGQVAVTMALFGIGAAAPLLIIGLMSREALSAMRGRISTVAAAFKKVFAVGLIVAGLMVLTGLDKRAEIALLEWTPDFITRLTTRF